MVTGRDLHCSDSPSPYPFEVDDLRAGFCMFPIVYDQWLCFGDPDSGNKKNNPAIHHLLFRRPDDCLL